jgi:predicted DsbA family dithiol-disulfide isomerase
MPFELHPEILIEGGKVTELFPGMSVENMFNNLNNIGNNYGVKFSGADLVSNTHSALLASEYAKEKGKFHEFHDKLFYVYFTEGKNIGDVELLKLIAESVGLNKDDMQKKIEDGSYEDNIAEAKNLAMKYKVNSTPTFIINDKHAIVGAQSIESFKKVLNG